MSSVEQKMWDSIFDHVDKMVEEKERQLYEWLNDHPIHTKTKKEKANENRKYANKRSKRKDKKRGKDSISSNR